MTRLPGLDDDELSDAQRRVHDAIAGGPRGEVAGPLRVWLQSPEMAERAQALGQYARYDSVLPPHLSELAILVTARVWSSGYEWAQHAPIAREAGVPEAAIDAIARAKAFGFSDDDMQAVFDFAVELHRDRRPGDAAYEAVAARLGERACVDLVAICGYYTLISMTINAFDVPNGDGPRLPALTLAPDRYFRG